MQQCKNSEAMPPQMRATIRAKGGLMKNVPPHEFQEAAVKIIVTDWRVVGSTVSLYGNSRGIYLILISNLYTGHASALGLLFDSFLAVKMLTPAAEWAVLKRSWAHPTLICGKGNLWLWLITELRFCQLSFLTSNKALKMLLLSL